MIMMQIGDAVIYVNEYGVEHDALLTAVHGGVYKAVVDGVEREFFPCVNLLFVLKDDTRTDGYGRQIGRESSVSHKNAFAAHGRYWKLRD